jgi:trehalose 6-phosphate phosphatase
MVSMEPSRDRPYDAVILDLDGVITSTDAQHFQAWKATFDPILLGMDEPQPAFSEGDYRRTVDGRSRLDGVRDFFASRRIDLPEGSPADGPDAATVQGIGHAKNARFQRLIADGDVHVFGDAIPALDAWRRAGLSLAVVSSSKNCRPVLQAAGHLNRFDAIVDGITAEELGLTGKPAPDLFLEAARRLDVEPARAVVIEDAEVGVDAGRRGGFGLVVGVDRSGTGSHLRERGAHVVVPSLDGLDLDTNR